MLAAVRFNSIFIIDKGNGLARLTQMSVGVRMVDDDDSNDGRCIRVTQTSPSVMENIS